MPDPRDMTTAELFYELRQSLPRDYEPLLAEIERRYNRVSDEGLAAMRQVLRERA